MHQFRSACGIQCTKSNPHKPGCFCVFGNRKNMMMMCTSRRETTPARRLQTITRMVKSSASGQKGKFGTHLTVTGNLHCQHFSIIGVKPVDSLRMHCRLDLSYILIRLCFSRWFIHISCISNSSRYSGITGVSDSISGTFALIWLASSNVAYSIVFILWGSRDYEPLVTEGHHHWTESTFKYLT